MEETSKKVRQREIKTKDKTKWSLPIGDWRPIPEFEGFYLINEYGQILSLTYGHLKSQCLLNDYPGISLCKNRKKKTYLVHRLVASVFIPNPNNLPQVNHKDCNKRNNHVSNLEWCTAKENTHHAINSGRSNPPKGERQWRSKLRDSDIPEIFRLKREGLVCRQIASTYSVEYHAIQDVIARRTFKHVNV